MTAWDKGYSRYLTLRLQVVAKSPRRSWYRLGRSEFRRTIERRFRIDGTSKIPEAETRREGRQWVIYYWDDEFLNGERRRKKKRYVLGPATMGEREAEKVRDEFLRPLNQGLVNIGSATKLDDYVESVYKPVTLPTLARRRRIAI